MRFSLNHGLANAVETSLGLGGETVGPPNFRWRNRPIPMEFLWSTYGIRMEFLWNNSVAIPSQYRQPPPRCRSGHVPSSAGSRNGQAAYIVVLAKAQVEAGGNKAELVWNLYGVCMELVWNNTVATPQSPARIALKTCSQQRGFPQLPNGLR